LQVPADSGAVATAGRRTAAVVADLVERAFWRRARVLTIEYSMKAPKTKTRQVAIHTSMALVNEPAGIDRSRPELWVVIVSIVRMLREVRAGADSRSIQKDSHDRRTTKKLGRYVVSM
jgi:hypothetical protein